MHMLEQHLSNIAKFGVPVVVALNRFSADSEAERSLVLDRCESLGVTAVESDHWASGGAGAEELASTVVNTLDSQLSKFRPLYSDDIPLWDKVRTIAQEIYGAADISGDKKVKSQFQDLQEGGFGHFPVCIAKTQYSFSTDPNLKGAPVGHIIPIREVRVSAGAELNEYATILGALAVMFAAINVVGGYLVTNRMLSMFKKKEDDQPGVSK